VISGFLREVNEMSSILEYYAASNGGSLPTFRETYRSHLQGSRKYWPLKIGPKVARGFCIDVVYNFVTRIMPQIYQINKHICLYNNIFTTFLLHVSVYYAPSSGRASRISPQNRIIYKVVVFGDLHHRI
jgi:hypothetical protein